MNKKEKIYIMQSCIVNFQNAILTQFTDPYMFFMSIGAGRALKKTIEEFIDCQSKPYYNMYQTIVKYANQLDHIGNGE